MIGVEKIGEIRCAYFEQHRSIKEIVRRVYAPDETPENQRRLLTINKLQSVLQPMEE